MSIGEITQKSAPTAIRSAQFSSVGKTKGMDLDGIQNNRGMYILAAVAPEMAIRRHVIQWSSPEGKLKGNVPIGFVSQVPRTGSTW